ncbi:MAG: LemA family protein [Firmicutes bacterium]|nr:LemA family protein [Bacillota bacterium]
MNKKLVYIIIGIVTLIFGVLIFSSINIYNNLVSSKESVDNNLSKISVQLERRADLIPNLVTTVKGYIKHEQSVINSITSSREKLVNADTVEEKAEANNQLSAALNNLFVIVENYPDLKSNVNFIQLQDELAGTENRIAVARTDYNNAVKEYNQNIKYFPQNIIANMFDFEEQEYFEASNASNGVPNVSFE